MKKLLLLLTATVIFATFSACGGTSETVVFMTPDGAPAVAAASLMGEKEIGGRQTDFRIINSAEEIMANVVNGTADVAIMPLNLAAKAYNEGTKEKVKLLSVNVFGCLYMVGKAPLDGPESLVGKVVYNIGQNATPDITFRYILEKNNIPYEVSETPVEGKVALQYVSDASALPPMFKTGKAEYGIMGEPAVTNCNAATGTTTVLDIQAEWEKVVGTRYPQAGVVINSELAGDAKFVAALREKLAANAEWCTANAADIKDVITARGSALTVNFTAELIGRCNVGYAAASEIKTAVEEYLGAVLQFAPNAVGKKLPDDGFYL